VDGQKPCATEGYCRGRPGPVVDKGYFTEKIALLQKCDDNFFFTAKTANFDGTGLDYEHTIPVGTLFKDHIAMVENGAKQIYIAHISIFSNIVLGSIDSKRKHIK